jgi:putative ABC transport system permease protein
VLKMILKDLRLSPLRSILTSVSMLVGIIAMLGSVLVGTQYRQITVFQSRNRYTIIKVLALIFPI